MVPCDQLVSPTDAEWRVLETWGGVYFVGHWLAVRVEPGCSSPLPVASCLFSVLCGMLVPERLN